GGTGAAESLLDCAGRLRYDARAQLSGELWRVRADLSADADGGWEVGAFDRIQSRVSGIVGDGGGWAHRSGSILKRGIQVHAGCDSASGPVFQRGEVGAGRSGSAFAEQREPYAAVGGPLPGGLPDA